MDAVGLLAPSITEALTWSEICERYPEQHVCVTEIERNPHNRELWVARVVGHGRTRREALEQAHAWRADFKEIGFRFTGENTTPLVRPSLILDDAIRHAIRYRR